MAPNSAPDSLASVGGTLEVYAPTAFLARHGYDTGKKIKD